MAYILKELADADELQAMKLAPAPNSSKTNVVGKYRSILRGANDSWSKAESSYADSSSYDYKKRRVRQLAGGVLEGSRSTPSREKTEWKEQQEQQEKH